MKKTLKIVGIVISIPVILFLIAAVVLARIDLNDYRTNIEQLVAENTGRQLSLKGDLKKSFFPWLGINVGSVALSNAKGFRPAEFASVEGVDIKIDTVSLLQLKPKIDRIIVKGLNLNLAKNKKGETNWDDLSKPAAQPEAAKEKTTPEPAKEQAPTGESGGEALALIDIAGITIEDANVSWVDDQAGASYAVKQVNLSVSEIALNKPLSLNLDFVLDSKEPNISAKVILSSEKIDWDIQNQRYAVTPLTIDINAKGNVLPISPLSTRIRVVADADLNKQKLIVSELKLSALDVALRAKASVDSLIDAPTYQSTLEIDKLNPGELFKKLGIELPSMKDKKVMSALSLNASVKGDLNQVQVPDLKLVLDDSTITAKASVKNFSKPAITASLSLDKMDLDRYLPPPLEKPATETKAVAKTAGNEKEEPLPIPVELIRSLDVDASVNAGKLVVQQINIDDLAIKARVKNGVATLSPVTLNLAGGSLRSDVILDVKGAMPHYSVKQSIKQVQAAPLVNAVAGEEYVSGVMNLVADVNTQGLLLSEIKEKLNGNTSFHFADGAAKGFNLGEFIRKVKAKIKNEDYKEKNAPLATDFAELKGSAVIQNGVVTNKDLSAKSPAFRVAGEGKVDLTKDYLNYLVTAYVVGTAKGQEGKELDELNGIPIPVRLIGPFDKLDYKVDYDPILKAWKAKFKKQIKEKVEKEKAIVREQVEEKKQEIKQESKEKVEEKKEELKEKAKDKLKKLFKF